MAAGSIPPANHFLPLLVKAYALGTALSAMVLHLAIALIAPGSAGTAAALGDGAILFILLIMLAFVGLIAFPIAAAASWPFRRLVTEHPLLSFLLAAEVGVLVGGMLTATEFQIGPGDFWSGPLVGLVYGAVWFWVVRSSLKRETDVAA